MTDALRLRQIGVITGAPESIVAEICATFGLSVAFQDPALARGLMQNFIIPVGDAFIEVAAPLSDVGPSARFLAKAGPGGLVAILQTDNIAGSEARLARNGVGIAHRIDTPEATELQLAHKDLGGSLLSIDAARPVESWLFGGPVWRDHIKTEVVTGFAGLDIACGDPKTIAKRWAAVLGRPVENGADGVLRVRLDHGSDIAFTAKAAGAPDRMVGVRLRAATTETIGRFVRVGTLTFSVVE